MEWQHKPTCLDYWPDNIDYILCIDENGDANLKNIRKKIKDCKSINKDEKLLTITGCIFSRYSYYQFQKDINKIKYKFWENGLFYYEKKKCEQRVCFRSYDIRKNLGPFNFTDRKTDADFKQSISDLVANADFTIISSTLDKEEHVMRYGDLARHPYNETMVFILERFSFYLKQHNANGIVMLEARGQKEDNGTLKHLVDLLHTGSYFVAASEFKSIEGIYFNSKWCHNANNQKSYVGLEFADLISFPIHKYWRESGVKDPAFKVFESKFYRYPYHVGSGLKIFPQKK